MKKLEVQEYAELIGKSRTAIYNSIKDNKLKYIVENINGRDVKKVLIEDEEYEELLMPDNLNQLEKQSSFKLNQPIEARLNNAQAAAESPIVMELMMQLKDSQKHFAEYNYKVNDLQNKLVVYAELAGQAKLLTDSENKTKEEYFKTIQENAQLKAQLDLKEQQLKEFQDKLKTQEESKNSSWWSKL